MIVELNRFDSLYSKYTLGFIRVDKTIICYTLELPWLFNQKTLSCIPEGSYLCKKIENITTAGGMRLPSTIQILNVPKRDGILFHPGNRLKDTLGCVLTGTGFDTSEEPFLYGSKKAFNTLMSTITTDKEFPLIIRRL